MHPPTSIDGSVWNMREPGATVTTVEEFLERMIHCRGLTQKELLPAHAECLHDPHLLSGIDRAADRIRSAIRQKQRIVLFGDYDNDGICGTMLLANALQGARIFTHIPDRFREGYGLQESSVAAIHAAGIDLVITVDNGITACDAVASLAASGIDTIVTDHHLPGAQLPPACAIVNANQPGCSYPNKDLCGSGVAWKLGEVLTSRKRMMEFIDLLALPTVADVVKLRGENRLIVQLGLEKLRRDPHPALKALFRERGEYHTQATAEMLGFRIAPLINATNRIPRERNEKNPALQLLLEGDGAGIASMLYLLEERQLLEDDAEQQLEAVIHRQRHRLLHIIVADKHCVFHEGIAGLLASHVVKKTGKPAIAIAWSNGLGKGSARSIPGFHLKEMLDHLQGDLLRYGGHAPAAGLTIEPQNLPAFQDHAWRYAERRLHGCDLRPFLEIDASIPLVSIKRMVDHDRVRFLEVLTRLGPFGQGNPSPQIVIPGVRFEKIHTVGHRGRHVSIHTSIGAEITEETDTHTILGFSLGRPRPLQFCEGGDYDIVVTPTVREHTVGLLMRSLRVAELPLQAPATSGDSSHRTLR